MDRLSITDLMDATWRLRAAWRRLHPDLGDDQMPETLRHAEQPTGFQSFLASLRSLIDGTEARLADPAAATGSVATTPAPAAPVNAQNGHPAPGRVELSRFAAKGGKARLFIDLRRFAEAPEWVQIIPRPGVFHHDWYGDIVITAERNSRFVANYEARVYGQDLPVDAEHETKLSGAFGWIRELRLNGDDSIDARIEWTERGLLAFEKEAFRYVSPEWFDWWEQPMTGVIYQDVLIGLALCNHPFFKESALEPVLPLVASENGQLSAPEGGSGQAAVFTHVDGPCPVGGADGPSRNPSHPEGVPEGARSMSEQEPNLQTVTLTAEQAQQFAELRTQHTALTERLAEQETQITQLSERNTALEEANARAARDAMVRRFTDEVRGRSDANPNAWIGEIEGNVGLLVDLAERLGEESDGFKFFVANQRAIAAQAKDSSLFTAIGGNPPEAAGSALEQLEAKAREHAEASKVSFAEAMGAVAQSHPELYHQYQQESRGR